MLIVISRKERRTSNANYAIAEAVVDFVTTAGAVGTEDDKTISQKDDKHINVPLSAHYIALSHAISHYLAKRKICAVYLR